MSFKASSHQLLQDQFQLQSFRKGQLEVLEALWTQSRALAVFPTGAGKSLTYQMYSQMAPEGLTLVVSPLIALMKDQLDALAAKGIAAGRLDSSLDPTTLKKVENGIRDGSIRLLYVSPERFNNERFVEMIQQIPIALFAIDEAHCISEWGHNFRPDYLKLVQIATQIQAKSILALTATATTGVVQDICKAFSIPESCVVNTGFYRKNLHLKMQPLPLKLRVRRLITYLKKRPPGSGIVYVTTQKTAEKLAGKLARFGLPVKAYHAGMEAEERTLIQNWWQQTPNAVVVATIAFGMGIDKSDVRYVYHFNLPKSLENYSQEIGRAGRDGKTAIVELMGDKKDLTILENFVYGDTPELVQIRQLVKEIQDAPEKFQVSLLSWSTRLDMRLLVLRTALTYLELQGIIDQGTPIYTEYQLKWLQPLQQIQQHWNTKTSDLYAQIFQGAKQGKIWITLDLEGLVQKGIQRNLVLRALDYLERQGWAEVKSGQVRQQYTRLHPITDPDTLARTLFEKFQHREKTDLNRLQLLVSLIESSTCQTNALMGYFGEIRDQPCGHCSACTQAKAFEWPLKKKKKPIQHSLDGSKLQSLMLEYPEALGRPRQMARFLCGLNSPALTAFKLTKHPLFGRLERYTFRKTLLYCQQLEQSKA